MIWGWIISKAGLGEAFIIIWCFPPWLIYLS